MTQDDSVIGAWVIAAIILTGMIMVGLIWLAVWGAAKIAGEAAPEPECRWCRRPGFRGPYTLPRDCTCPVECAAPWCQKRPVTA